MADAEQEKVIRKQRKAAVTRVLNRIKRRVAENNIGQVKEDLEQAITTFENFEGAHDKYHSLVTDDADIQESENYFLDVENCYIETLNFARDWLDSKADVKPDKSSSPSKIDVSGTLSSTCMPEIVSLMNLPKVDLEPFDGDAMKFHSFISMFDESVGSVLQDGNAKLVRLLQYTRGRAKDAIRQCSLIGGDEGYKQARKILLERFGNDHIITERIVRDLRNGKPVRSAFDLLKLSDELSNCMLTLGRMKKLSEIEGQTCIVEVVNRLQPFLRNRWKKVALDKKRESGSYPKFDDLVKFIEQQAEEANDPVYGSIGCRYERRESTNREKDPKPVSSFSSFTENAAQGGKRRYSCIVCDGDHRVLFCDKFKGMKLADRISVVKDHRLCENCLIPNHRAADCRKPAVCSVPGCGRKHTRYIHVNSSQESNTSVVGNSSRTSGETSHHPGQRSNSVSCALSDVSAKISVPVVSVVVNNEVTVNALLDSGSTSSFCSRSLANQLKLNGEKFAYTLNTLSKTDEDKLTEIVNLDVESVDGNEYLRMSNVIIVDRIPVNVQKVDTQAFPHLCDVTTPNGGSTIDLLIGQDHAVAFVPLETRVGRRGDPFAVKTLFGWAINGPSSPVTVNQRVVSHFVTTSSIDKDFEGLWRIEDEGVARDEVTWSVEDRRVMKLWDATCVTMYGHYQIPIPWKPGAPFPNNFTMAKSRLMTNIASLKKRGLFGNYDAEIMKLIDEGYAERIPTGSESRHIWYLPHHVAISEKKPEKFRIVFDCAAKFQGQSLNDKCYQGPDLNNRLLNVLVRFRNHEVATMADIKCMYYQVKVPPEQRDCLRFLWINDHGDIHHLRMTSHVFGGVWSGSAAAYALRRTVDDTPNVLGAVKKVIRDGFYVDDCLVSFRTIEESSEVMAKVKGILEAKGFHLTKFISNNNHFLLRIPPTDHAPEVKDLHSNLQSCALGIKWDVSNDQLYFEVNLKKTTGPITKRIILSQVSSLFDPLGLISPVLIKARILFQEATRLKTEWDDPLPPHLLDRWNNWSESLKQLSSFRVPRCVKLRRFDSGVCELHHFSDASSAAYGCCSYLRCTSEMGELVVTLLCSKSRVAPLKVTTVPRLELQAAVLAARQDAALRQEMQLELGHSYFWTDSEIVLKYLSNDSRRFHVFVANRVSEIHSLTNSNQWFHVSSLDNPADIISRGLDPEDMVTSKWIRGPEFLRRYKSEWNLQESTSELHDDDPELRRSSRGHGVTMSCVSDVKTSSLRKLINYYSDWVRLKRGVAWMIRFMSFLRSKKDPTFIGSLTAHEIEEAEIVILRHVQSQRYPKEIDSLKRNGVVFKSSPLLPLAPKIDGTGLLRVGGRLGIARIAEGRRHPCIVPYDDQLATLIARYFHGRAHLGIEWTLSLMRERFWIIKGRSMLKRIQRDCIICKKLFAYPECQLMSDLPKERVEAGKPAFSAVGVDCFGPVYSKVGRSQVKRYGCLFTCFSTRAIHIEMLYGLDADSFLNGLRRFVTRRGQPEVIWSDNGTNFVGGLSEIASSSRELNWERIRKHCADNYIEWNFIPPSAPHMGGLWERMIRTVKKVLKSILGSTPLRDDVIETLFCEVECIVNGRPITSVSDDPFDLAPLTPNHLLLLRHGPPPLPGQFDGSDQYRKRWRHVQFLSDQFWKRWQKEYLPLLQRRGKWSQVNPNVTVGDVVLIVDEKTTRGLWPLGLVVDATPSRDGLVRKVTVRTKSSELLRPVTKVVKLDSSS